MSIRVEQMCSPRSRLRNHVLGAAAVLILLITAEGFGQSNGYIPFDDRTGDERYSPTPGGPIPSELPPPREEMDWNNWSNRDAVPETWFDRPEMSEALYGTNDITMESALPSNDARGQRGGAPGRGGSAMDAGMGGGFGGGMGMGQPGTSLDYQWVADSDSAGFSMQKALIKTSTMLPPKNMPPLNISAEAGTFLIDTPSVLGLPDELYNLSLGIGMPIMLPNDTMMMLQSSIGVSGEFSTRSLQLGLRGMGRRALNERSNLMFIAGANTLVDTDRVDADEVQAMVIGMWQYQWTEQLQLMLGVGYLGTQAPFPVLPVIGLDWRPRDDLHLSLMLPNPRVSYRLSMLEDIQWWGYVGGGPDGGTWYVERADGFTRPLQYSQFKFVLGVERRAEKGAQGGLEIGYAFGRSLEIEEENWERDFDAALTISTTIRF